MLTVTSTTILGNWRYATARVLTVPATAADGLPESWARPTTEESEPPNRTITAGQIARCSQRPRHVGRRLGREASSRVRFMIRLKVRRSHGEPEKEWINRRQHGGRIVEPQKPPAGEIRITLVCDAVRKIRMIRYVAGREYSVEDVSVGGQVR